MGTQDPVPRAHAEISLRRQEAVLLAAGVVLLGVAMLLPWWSETATLGSITEVQSYSPWNGVTVSCSPSCGTLTFTPEPVPGVNSFESLDLGATGLLYHVSLGFVVVALAFGVIALVGRRSSQNGRASAWGSGVGRYALLVSVVAAGVGSALLPLLQPTALRSDLNARFSPNTAWTASPSPETSFWGSCSPGQYHGLCASGASASWGPGLGWILLVVSFVLLVVTWSLTRRRPRSAADPRPGLP